MKIAKTLTLAFATTIILAAYSAPSFAEYTTYQMTEVYVSSSSTSGGGANTSDDGDDGESLLDWILSWL